tara:strand:- start:2869 stop:3738 length:870 start_codon:yes stop_codon:yes gene_type:complete
MKSHFKFSKEQRKGIFLLILLIFLLQCIYFFVEFSFEDIQVNKDELTAYIKEIDSLKLAQVEKIKPKTYPFNPNYITDYKGVNLGMSNEEIDRFVGFRKQNKWINSAKQFQEVTKVSDSLLNIMAPFFKFPEWVTNAKSKRTSNYSVNNKLKTFNQKQDLNTATVQQLQKVNGLGKVLSERIVKFRNQSVGGFISDIQLQDVYGLAPEVIDNITNQFTVKTPKTIDKINLNLATLDYLVTIPHIDYDLAYNIIEERLLRENYKSLDELTKVKDFPVNKIEIIKLYLSLD